MCAGVVIGLTALVGLKLVPGKSGSAIKHEHVGSVTASDVSSVGMTQIFLINFFPQSFSYFYVSQYTIFETDVTLWAVIFLIKMWAHGFRRLKIKRKPWWQFYLDVLGQACVKTSRLGSWLYCCARLKDLHSRLHLWYSIEITIAITDNQASRLTQRLAVKSQQILLNVSFSRSCSMLTT